MANGEGGQFSGIWRTTIFPSLPQTLRGSSKSLTSRLPFCRGDESLAYQETPKEDSQRPAEGCLHWSLAPCPGGLLDCPGWPEGLPPPHRTQQEGMIPLWPTHLKPKHTNSLQLHPPLVESECLGNRNCKPLIHLSSSPTSCSIYMAGRLWCYRA